MPYGNEYLYLRKQARNFQQDRASNFQARFRPVAPILLVGMRMFHPERLIDGEIVATRGKLVWIKWEDGSEDGEEVGYSRLVAMKYRAAYIQTAI